ncbi:MAG: tyrosine-type recombinase/integrase [Nitrospira sp.]|nr:tyrosine-type recombinase/integrase [Nitrospira sp.]
MGIYKKDKNWYIDYYFRGKRKRKKVGPSRKLAEQVLKDVQVKIIKREYLGVYDEKKILFEDFAKEYLEYVKANKSSGMADNEEGYLDTHLKPTFGRQYLYEITPQAIEKLKAELLEKLEPGTVNRYLACLKHMFRKAIEWGYLKANPANGVRKLKEPPGRLRYLAKTEVQKLLLACPPRLSPIVMTALHTGMRRNELLKLTWQNVDLDNRTIRVEKPKNNESRTIPMNETLFQAIRKLVKHPHSAIVFPSRGGRPYTDVPKTFRKAVETAKIEDFHFHDLRHTFASYMMMNGCDVKTLQELMGHKDIKMTMRYAHLSRDHVRQSVKVLDTIWTPDPNSRNTNQSQVTEK